MSDRLSVYPRICPLWLSRG